MATVCMHCAMRAIVAGDREPVVFDVDEHMARVHHDREASQRERVDLERQVRDILNLSDPSEEDA